MALSLTLQTAYANDRPPPALATVRLSRVGGRRPLWLRVAMYVATLATAMTLLALQLGMHTWAWWSAVLILPALVWAWWLYEQQLQSYAEAARAVDRAVYEHATRLQEQVREGTGELLLLAQELSLSNDELRREMTARAKIELELRQAHKLESVGRLAAGVAHEINTPVQFVSDSCHFLRDGVADLSAIIEAYRSALQRLETHPESLVEERQRLAAEEVARDVEYLLQNLPSAVERSLEGLARVATIVRAMKAFAHPERSNKTHADLNQAIQNTLEIARNEYKYVADVVTEFGDLPPVPCYLSELNQAVLNLVVNAAHAIAERVAGTEERGVITVSTKVEGDEVLIAVSDTGSGIPEEIREKIFDPFFTTKEVGHGTGQGLGVVHSVIVEKHRGRVQFTSELGVGTTFTLHIPLGSEA